MPVRPEGPEGPSVGGELGPDAAHGREAFVDLECEHDRACLGGDEDDAVGSQEAAQDVRRQSHAAYQSWTGGCSRSSLWLMAQTVDTMSSVWRR